MWLKSKICYNPIKMGKYPFVTDFNVIVCPPKRAEATADTLRAYVP